MAREKIESLDAARKAELVCAVCGINDRCKRCELINGSWLTLCAPHRAKLDELISSVPMSGPEDRHAEEDAAIQAEPELDGVERCSCDESMALRALHRRYVAQQQQRAADVVDRWTRWNRED